MKKSKNQNSFSGYNIRVYVPEGTIYVQIAEDHSGDPFLIFISAGKTGQPLQILVNSIANMINEMWAAGISTSTIIRALDTPYSPKYAQNHKGIKIFSTPHGIQWALIQYLQLKNGSIPLNVAI